MTIPTVGINEASPAGSDNISSGDNRIREHKVQVREILEKDHEYPTTGQSATAGQHKKVTLQEQADLGTGAVSATILGSQTVGGKGEVVYTDEDDNDIQLTNAGTPIAINAVTAKTAPVPADAILLNDSEASNVSKSCTLANLANVIYPVGAIFTTVTAYANSAAVVAAIGGTTWVSFGAGKVLVGLDSGDTDFDTVEETGGAKTHTLTESEMPAHTHTDAMYNANGWSSGDNVQASNATSAAGNLTTNSTGGDGAHNNVQPYIVVYMWKRTA
jgi:hypothetical protein